MEKFYIENENKDALVENIVKVDSGTIEELKEVGDEVEIVEVKGGTIRDIRVLFTKVLEDALYFNYIEEAESFVDRCNLHNDAGDLSFMVSSGNYVKEKYGHADKKSNK